MSPPRDGALRRLSRGELPDVDVRAANSTTEAAGLVHDGRPRGGVDAAAAREHADIRWHEADDWIDGVRGMIE